MGNVCMTRDACRRRRKFRAKGHAPSGEYRGYILFEIYFLKTCPAAKTLRRFRVIIIIFHATDPLPRLRFDNFPTKTAFHFYFQHLSIIIIIIVFV